MLRRRARVPAVHAVQVRAQTPGPVAVEPQVRAAVAVLAGRRRRRRTPNAPSSPDDGRLLCDGIGRRDGLRQLGERHLLGRVRTESTATVVRLVAGRREFRARRQLGQHTHSDAVAHGPAAARGQEQDVHGHATTVR